MFSENLPRLSYADFMDGGHPYIELHIDFRQPIEIANFVGAFTSISSQYNKFIRSEHPDLSPDAQMYVRELRPGSIVAELLPWATAIGLPVIIQHMDQALIVENFIRTYGARLAAYFKLGGRDTSATRSDLKDFMGAVAAIANDPNATSKIEAVAFEDGKRKVRAAIKFNTNQAAVALDEIQKHQIEMERTQSAEHQRVLMKFNQSNIKSIEPGKRTGERVVIPDISDKERALIYASDLAEQRIKHEIREADDNVYKKGFIVDANVQLLNGKPVAYRITHCHDTIDLPDEDEL